MHAHTPIFIFCLVCFSMFLESLTAWNQQAPSQEVIFHATFLTEKAGHDGYKHVRSISVSCNGIQEQEQNCGQQTAIRSVSTLPGVALRHYGEELLHSRRVSPARVLIHPLNL